MTLALEQLLAQASESESATSLVQGFAQTLGCRHRNSAADSLKSLLELGVARELVADCLRQLTEILPGSPDPDRGLTNLVRYISASRSPQALLALFERDPTGLPTLMRILATSQSWSEQLILDPESFDLLRLTEGLPVSRGILVDELTTEIAGSTDAQWVARCLHKHKQRETMRIAFGDFIGAMPIEIVTHQLSTLAEAILETALEAALRDTRARFGVPLASDGTQARITIIGYGLLGGNELSYAPRIDLLFLCDPIHAIQDKRSAAHSDFFERVARRTVAIVSDTTHATAQYWMAMDLRPQSSRDQLVSTLDAAVRYFENQGQTWQRQAFIKARHVAGDASLAQQFLTQLEPWVYRRYLSRSDITEIAALKRQLGKRVHDSDREQVAPRHGPLFARAVSHRAGEAGDIEFLIQYLQLLNGGELSEVRIGNTLDAIAALEHCGCLTAQERSVLDDNYRFLRKLEHRLQIVFGDSTETLPSKDPELRQYLIAADFVTSSGAPDPQSLDQQLTERTKRNSRILNHLLSETFSEADDVAPETDLILDPAPTVQQIQSTLAQYGFSDPQSAYRELAGLGHEQVAFLSTRRCRHFLAAIAPRLLQSLAKTPAPDLTLSNLQRVSASLGGKAVLWELFQSSHPAMDLCVRLCATTPYLVGILTSNPGMIDELIDSLMLDRLPSTQQIETLLGELCRGVQDPGLVLHSFKNSMHLNIGVRDVLGKDDIARTHRALADVAEACLKQTIEHEFHRLVQKLGVPIVAQGPRAGEPAELIVLAVGKLGGREPNYHSDLDVLFLFDGEGTTRSLLPHRRHDSIANRQFFNQLAQRVVKSITKLGPSGHLYELDARLRPLGGGVGQAISLDDLENYFCHGPAQLWERQALCKARPVWVNPTVMPRVAESLRTMQTSLDWSGEFAADIQRHRVKLEHGAAATNIKRARGGTLDIEFIVQMLQLKHGRQQPQVLVPGTIEALGRLQQFGFLSSNHARPLDAHYRWLRSVESGLRLMNLAARHELPTAVDQLDQLQFLLQSREPATGELLHEMTGPHETTGSLEEHAAANASAASKIPATHRLTQICSAVLAQNRQMFNEIFSSSRSAS